MKSFLFRGAATAGGTLPLPPNKHPYLFSLGHVAPEATGPCQKEMSACWWRLSPRTEVKGQSGRWQQSRGAAERQGDWQSGEVSLGTAGEAAPRFDGVPAPASKPGWFSITSGLFAVGFEPCRALSPRPEGSLSFC